MAAGLGSRMRELTRDIPKPMIKINNKELISTLIDALYFNGIDDILVIGGYKYEIIKKFLEEKYPKVKLLKNEYYQVANNISSVFVARKYLDSNVLICESDLFVSNKNIFMQIYDKSGYFSFFKEGKLDDWCFTVLNGRINRIKRQGENDYMMTGVSYFNETDAKILKSAITKSFENGRHDLYWDEVIDKNLAKIDMRIYNIQEGDLVELDTPEDIHNLVEEINGRN